MYLESAHQFNARKTTCSLSGIPLTGRSHDA